MAFDHGDDPSDFGDFDEFDEPMEVQEMAFMDGGRAQGVLGSARKCVGEC